MLVMMLLLQKWITSSCSSSPTVEEEAVADVGDVVDVGMDEQVAGEEE